MLVYEFADDVDYIYHQLKLNECRTNNTKHYVIESSSTEECTSLSEKCVSIEPSTTKDKKTENVTSTSFSLPS